MFFDNDRYLSSGAQEDAGLAEGTHPLTTLTIQLSEDHCWLQWTDPVDGSAHTAEVAVAKHKVTAAAEVTSEMRKAWLYLGGRQISCCSTARTVCAMLQNINPECTKQLDSAALRMMKLSLLQRVHQCEPSATYPGECPPNHDRLARCLQARCIVENLRA